MNKKIKVLISITIIVLAITCSIIPILAKYIKKVNNNIQINSTDFYFTSDLLDVPAPNGTFPEYTLGKGTNTITFRLNNYEDDLRFTTIDIDYEIKVTNLSDAIVFEETGTLNASSTKNSKQFDITSLASDTYIVEVTSTSPYIKQLKGKFIIQDVEDDITYTVSDGAGSTVVMLTISVNDYSGNINIKWPDGVFPDNSDPLLKDAINTTNYIVNFNSYSEYTFVFFKNDTSVVFTNADFEVTK